MIEKVIPRYLRVAHWLNDQAQPMTANDIAKIFGVGTKAINDDFAKIRRRSDIIESSEKKITSIGGTRQLLKVIFIHSYILDERQCPQRSNDDDVSKNSKLTWHDLLSKDWSSLHRRF
ncbi:MAG: hypothetical protein ACRCVV_09085 [Shewanella sp.]